MRNWKRGMTLLLTLLMLFAAAALAEGTDALTCGEAADLLLAAADDYAPSVQRAELLADTPAGPMEEQAALTRINALLMLRRAFGALPAPEGDSARMAAGIAFDDLPAWAEEAIGDVLAAGIAVGDGSGQLFPDAPVTRDELNSLIRRVYAYLGGNLRDDFYATINRDWLNASDIPAGLSINGPFYGLTLTVNEQVAALIADIDAQAQVPGSAEAKIKALYDCVLDTGHREQEGIAPIQSYLDAIASAATLEELMEADALITAELGFPTLLGYGVTTDLANSAQHIVTFSGVGAMMDKDFYLNGTPEQTQVYLGYLETLFELSGLGAQDAQAQAQLVYEAEKAISAASLDPQEYGDVDRIYNLYTPEALDVLFPNVDLAPIYALTGMAPTDRILVMDTGALEAAAALFDDAHLDTLKAVARQGLLLSVGTTLNKAFLEASFDFTLAYYGVDARQSDEQIAAQLVQSLLADYLGRAYVDAHFSAEAKADVENMIRDFIAIYKQRLETLDWMSESTREKAICKLDTMGIKVGYPDSWETYLDDAEILSPEEGGTFFSNTVAIARASAAEAYARQSEPVDKTEWAMYPFTVNACYNVAANDITFPAAILQSPLYDVDAPREANLGGIGYIIAHEITHAFDNNGAKFDENGNSADWWTAEDYAAFQARCEAVVAWYDGQEAYPGVACSGVLTLSENVADLGSARCVLTAAQVLETPDLDLLFRSMANTWASTTSPQLRAYLAAVDVHAPDKLRCNRVLQTLPEFYETYGIGPEDGMWTEPESRVSIW